MVSSDGHWLTFTSTDAGKREVFVEAIAGGGGRHQISTDGGGDPAWSPDGKTIYYRANGTMIAARLSFAPAFVVTRRDTLFTDLYSSRLGPFGSYRVAPDGKHFLMVGGEKAQRAVVVVNWQDELRERMAMATRR
jgi:Tol biopolymer transport system component